MVEFDERRLLNVGDFASRLAPFTLPFKKWSIERKNRKSVQQLLRKEDYVLRDMGIEREDVLAALAMHGDASDNLNEIMGRE